MWLYPSHEKRHDQYYKQADREHDTNGQELDRAVGFIAVFYQGEHACTQAQ